MELCFLANTKVGTEALLVVTDALSQKTSASSASPSIGIPNNNAKMNDVKAKSGDGVIIRDSSAGSLLDSDSQIVDIVGTERNKKKRKVSSDTTQIIPCHALSSQNGLVVLYNTR